MRTFSGTRPCPAFTLLDTLVAVTVAGSLAVLFVPVLKQNREKGQRAVCRANLRRLSIASQSYAADHHGYLFPQKRNDGDWMCFNISGDIFAIMARLAGDKAVDCPNLYPFTMPGLVYEPGSRVAPDSGRIIGYNYCGGILEKGMPGKFGWVSPTKTSDDGSLVLFADLNGSGYNNGYWAVASHTSTGASRIQGESFLRLHMPVTARHLGAQGGNVCLLDGSIRWKPVREMRDDYWIYQGDFGDRGMW
ncbi:MAG TPA: type II secretion system protein [Candidatus Limnocylindria bacterium]|nr:type II secretion system protein [Candidatus Limnocylindria bacterium]